MSRQGKGAIRWLGVSGKGVRWRIWVEVEVEVEVEVVRCALCVAEEDEKFWFWCWWWWARELQKQRREETRLWTPNGNHTKRREGEGFARRPVSTTILAKGVNNMQNRAREIFAEPWIA
jgi:hypothetical protein